MSTATFCPAYFRTCCGSMMLFSAGSSPEMPMACPRRCRDPSGARAGRGRAGGLPRGARAPPRSAAARLLLLQPPPPYLVGATLPFPLSHERKKTCSCASWALQCKFALVDARPSARGCVSCF